MSWFSKLRNGLSKSSSKLGDGITGIFTKKKLDDETLQGLEELLITSDLGVETTSEIIRNLSQSKYNKEVSEAEIKSILAQEISDILAPCAKNLVIDKSKKPYVILVVGVNGNGKTTSIGKIANNLRQDGNKVLVAAADTFRAAAIGQLKTWAERAGVEIFAGTENQDPASVAYQAIEKARAENFDVVLVDTAGRLQNKSNLMAELSKIKNICSKFSPESPHEVILVLDATTGQNAISQATEFGEKAGVTGLIVTKLDGTAKGGVVVALAKRFALPIYAIGVGEGINDMKPFDSIEFSSSLVGI